MTDEEEEVEQEDNLPKGSQGDLKDAASILLIFVILIFIMIRGFCGR